MNQDNQKNHTQAFIITLVLMFGLVLGAALMGVFNKSETTITGEGADKYSTINLEKAYTPNAWNIDGDNVYVNDSLVFINANPHTINGAGWVEFNFTSKVYTGDVDMIFGFDTNYLKPKAIQVYNPHLAVRTVKYNCGSDYNKVNYTLTPTKHFWCWTNQTTGYYTLEKEHDFDGGDLANKIAWWNETYIENWVDYSDTFTKIDLNFQNMTTWYYNKDIPIVEDRNYNFRVFISPTVYNIGNSKYWFAIKPSSETIQESILNNHFYALDPWNTGWNTSLIAYYPFNETSGTTAYDVISGYNGTLYHDTAINKPSLTDTAYYFDGSGDNVTVPDTAALDFGTGNYTITTWVLVNATANSGQIVSKQESSGSYTGWSIRTNYLAGYKTITFTPTGGSVACASTTKYNDSLWHFVAIVRAGTGTDQTHLYIDGSLEDDCTDAGNNANAIPLGFAKGVNFATEGMLFIDDTAFWNKELMSSISTMYNSGTPIQYELPPSAPTDNSPVTTIDTPSNALTINNYLITFNGTAYDDLLLQNITLYGNFSGSWASNQTNSSPINNSQTKFSLTLPNGAYKWNYYACDNKSQCAFAAANYTFNVSVSGDGTNPSMTLNTPIDNYNTTANDITFNCTATDNINITNITFIFNGNVNQTNSTPYNNSETKFSLTLPENDYNWTCGVCDNSSHCVNATARYFTIDNSGPWINITVPPVNYSNYSATSIPYSFITNVSIIDSLLAPSICWVDNGTINTTVTCGDNATLNFSDGGNWITWWANDTLGNTNYSIIYLFISLTNYSLYYPSSVVEETNHTYVFNITATALTSSDVNFTYNDTVYEMLLQFSNNTFAVYNYTLTTPDVTEEAYVNLSFQYEINGDSSSTENFTQTISDFQQLTVTAAACDDLIYNFTFYDEGNLTKLNFMMDYLIYYGEADNTSKFIASGHFAQESAIYMCINASLPVTWYIGYGELYYSFWENGTYVNRRYYFDNGSAMNASNYINVSLYGLWRDDATPFEVSYKDQSYSPVSGAIIQALRKYIARNDYYIVEMEKTDSYGKTTFNFDTDSAIYKFIVTKDGITLKEFDDSRVFCQNPTITPCIIALNNYQNSLPVTDYEEEIDLSYSVTSNRTARSINLTYSIPSGSNHYVSLNVTREDALGTDACSDITFNDAADLGCFVPASIGNSTVRVDIYKNGTLVASQTRSFSQTPTEIYGAIAVILAVFVLLTLIGAAMSDNPIFTIIFFMIGIILLVALGLVTNNGFIGGAASILFLIIAIILIIIKGGKRS